MDKDMKSRYFHEGISKLPDDVLLDIFTYLVCDSRISISYRPIKLFRIAGVCRRFRDIVFSHAPFWNDISARHKLEAVDMALLRSKQAPLTASVSSFISAPGKSTTFLKKILTHAHRVTALFVNFLGLYNDTAPVRREINDALRLLSESGFHALEEFSLHAPRPYVGGHGIPDDPEEESNHSDIVTDEGASQEAEHMDGDESDSHSVIYDGDSVQLDEEENEGPVLPMLATTTDDDLLHVYLHWRLSSLKRLTLYQLVPRVQPELALTSLHLECDANWYLPERPLTQLMKFIKTQSRLQRLTLIIYIGEMGFAWKETIHMPELRWLRLETPRWENHEDHYWSSIPQIFQHLLTPSAETIKLKFPIPTDGFTLETIFIQDYPRLTEITLALTCENVSRRELAPFRFILSRFPLLTYLSLGLAYFNIRIDVPDPFAHPPPPLKRLSLTNIASLDMDGLKKVVEYMGNGEGGNSLEYLLVHDCPELTGTKDQIDVLKQLLPNCANLIY
jgi:hypothetical protein